MLSVVWLETTGFLRGQVYLDTVVLVARHGLVLVLTPLKWWRHGVPQVKCLGGFSVFSMLSGDDYKSHNLYTYIYFYSMLSGDD